MSRAHDALRAGDALRIDGTGYVAAGRMVLRTPDASHWSEWLLVPADSTPALALKEQTHRWLCRDEDGLSLWRPEPIPPGLLPEALSHGDEKVVDGLRYRVAERDSARVERIEGDVGGEASVGASFEYAELRNGQRRLALEWDARGAAMTRFRKLGEHDLIAWSRAAGSALPQRSGLGVAVATGAAGRAALVRGGDGASDSKWGSLPGIGIAIMAVLAMTLGSCDDDCYTRTNPVTGQQERVCDDDGMRVRSDGRRFGGWNGK